MGHPNLVVLRSNKSDRRLLSGHNIVYDSSPLEERELRQYIVTEDRWAGNATLNTVDAAGAEYPQALDPAFNPF